MSGELVAEKEFADRPAQTSTLNEVLAVLKAVVQSKQFPPVLVALLGIGVFFYPLLKHLVPMWLDDDHYSHGFLIPVISGYVIYKWWPRLSLIPAVPGYASLFALIPILVIARSAWLVDQQLLYSFSFLGVLLCAVWFLAGWRWMLGLSLPILYMAFMLPVWLSIIDVYTYPLQLISTRGAYHCLNLIGQAPQMDPTHPTDIYLDHFNLNVAVPCSGMKTLLAISAFTCFFLMIANIKWWARGVMVLIVLPLSLVTNSLRIALVGLVGNTFGEDAGHQFHDYSGYIMLLVCFYALFKIARGLGWKD